jgi:hypothetical protein
MLLILLAEQKAATLQETLRRKESEFQALEERYKKYIEKAKSVIKTLDPKQNPGSAEVAVLRSQLLEKHKIIEDLEVRYCVLQLLLIYWFLLSWYLTILKLLYSETEQVPEVKHHILNQSLPRHWLFGNNIIQTQFISYKCIL